jgi:hypothetical protein
MGRRARNLLLVLGVAMTAPPAFAVNSVQSSQPAKWVNRDVNFTYQGFTTHYSCDGLRDSAKAILRALGANWPKNGVRSTPCSGFSVSQISHWPGIEGHVAVLVPATSEEISRRDPGLVSAHWKTVNLMQRKDLDTRRGANCELLEQAKRDLLPLFATRNLEFSAICVAHATAVTSTVFTVDVLEVDPKPDLH